MKMRQLCKPMNSPGNKAALVIVLLCIVAVSLSCFIFDRPIDHYKKGNEYYSQKQWDNAVEEYKTAISMDSSQPFFYINRALSYNQIGEYDLAIADCSKAIDKNLISRWRIPLAPPLITKKAPTCWRSPIRRKVLS